MSLVDTRFDQMFPVLNAVQIETARRFASGAARRFAPGELVYDVGVRNAPAWLVLDGGLEVMRRDGLHRQTSVVLLTEGQFSGEVSQLAGRGTLAAAQAGPDGCTALPFDAAHIRALVIGSAELGEIVMRAFILRRVALIQEGGVGSLLIGRPGSPDLVRLEGFLSRNGYPYTVLDAASDEEARAAVERFGVQPDELPLMICPNGIVPQAADRRRSRHVPRHHAGARPQDRLRRRRGRRRPRRPCRRGLWRVGRPVGDRARSARLRRTGRRLGAHRELSRLSRPAFPARRWPAAPSPRRRSSAPRSPFPLEVTRLDCGGAPSKPFRLDIDGGTCRAGARRRRRLRRALSPAGDRQPVGLRRRRRVLLGLAHRSQALRGRRGGADRRRQFGRAGGGVSRAQGQAAASDRARQGPRGQHVALSDRPHQGAAERRAAHRHRSGRARRRPRRRD